MSKFSKFGASALALALSFALVSPVTANAYVYSSEEGVYDIDRSGTATIDEDGRVTRDVKSTVYKNRITGQTWDASTDNDDAEWASQNYVKDIKKLTIGTDAYAYFTVTVNPGDTLGKVKVTSGKKNITIGLYSKEENDIYPTWDDETKEVYFRNDDNTKNVIATSDTYPTEAQYNAWKTKKATYIYRIFGKKVGSAKFQYTLNGKKKTVKVTVSDDARVFQNVTFAGKSLWGDDSKTGTNANNLYSQTSNKDGIYYTTKKSGKFSVKMGKNYKFIKTYVIKDTPYETKTSEYGDDDYKRTTTYLRRKVTTGIDLNGDGDTLDTVYGLDEDDYTADTVQTIKKKSAKIKLSTSATEENTTVTNKYGETTDTYTKVSKSNTATTTVIVVYQNKLTKEYGTQGFTITCRTSKK